MTQVVVAWVEYVIALAGLFFLMAFFMSYGMLMVLVLCAMLPVLSYVMTRIIRQQVEFDVRIQHRVMGKGAENKLFLCADKRKDKGILRYLCLGHVQFQVRCCYGLEQEGRLSTVELPIRPKGTQMELSLYGKYCGLVRIYLEEVTIQSFFHFFQRKQKMEKNCEYLILPEEEELFLEEKSLGGAGNDELSDEEVVGDNSSVMLDIREYRAGDRLQKIHWKASARKEEWMVKEYAATISRQAVLVVELSRDSESCDAVLELTASFLKFELTHYGSISVMWWNQALGQFQENYCSDIEQVELLVRQLCYVPVQEEEDKAFRMLAQEQERAGLVYYIGPAKQMGKAGSCEQIVTGLRAEPLAGLWRIRSREQ